MTPFDLLVSSAVPRRANAPDYISLAALLHRPGLLGERAMNVRAGDFVPDLLCAIARIAMAHVRAMGRVDLEQLCSVVTESGVASPAALALAMRTIARIGDLIPDAETVDRAVADLIARRRAGGAR